ncbi:MAG: OmpH family outer membrane protein [Candidatus Krumholzibacteriota bacterium]|nr:OmpH family outer membrane protein [Candidatus Krumholzibacteriota bacterium]
MKKRISAILLLVYVVSMLPAASLRAEEVKIGYIDTVKIFANFKETVEAEEIYKKEVESWKKKAEEMETELAQMRETIQSQTLMLSEEKLQEKKMEFDQAANEYRKYMNDIFGENGEAARRNKELTDPIVEKINAVISKIAEEQGFTMVFDAAQGNIIYADKSIDLTDTVIAELEAQLETAQ